MVNLVDTLDASSIASLCLSVGDAGKKEQERQTAERLSIIRLWQDHHMSASYTEKEEHSLEGKNIAELGGGQGDATACLAALMRAHGSGKVVAVDPGPPDYGSPFTLAQAQSHLSQGPLGPHIDFVRSDSTSYLENSTPEALVSIHSLWYFAPGEFGRTVQLAAERRVPRIYLAEWDFSPAHQSTHALAHHKAVEIQLAHPLQDGNIRSVLTATEVLSIMEHYGYKTVRLSQLVSPKVKDAAWEVDISKAVLRQLLSQTEGEQKQQLQRDLDDLDRLCPKGQEVPTLNVWVAAFEFGSTRDRVAILNLYLHSA